MASKSDAVAIGGNKPLTEEFMQALNRQASGLPPEGAVDVTARFNGEDVPIPVSVARDALHKRMGELNRRLSSADNIPNPYQFAGNGNPYLADMIRQHQAMEEMAIAEIEQVKAELERLGKLTDAEAVRWAVTDGHIHRHANGGWVVR
jgi:hypothetical protein